MVRFRKEVVLAFNKLNLWPFPKVPRYFYFEPTYSYGFFKSKAGFPVYTWHMKKSAAEKLLKELIHVECSNRCKVSNIQVIWRHTGGYGNQARNFLFIREKELYLYGKVGRRYRLFHAEDEHYIAACIPDHLFTSAVEAWGKFKETGKTSWFPESRDQIDF